MEQNHSSSSHSHFHIYVFIVALPKASITMGSTQLFMGKIHEVCMELPAMTLLKMESGKGPCKDYLCWKRS